jgi:hypothetical protein
MLSHEGFHASNTTHICQSSKFDSRGNSDVWYTLSKHDSAKAHPLYKHLETSRRDHAIYLFQSCCLLFPFPKGSFKHSCEIWGLLAEEGLSLLFVRPARYSLVVQTVAGYDCLRIYSIGSLRKVALLSHLEKGVGVQDK